MSAAPCPTAGRWATLSSVDQLRLAYFALAVGLMGFGAVWGWWGVRRAAGSLPRGFRVAAALLLLLAVGGTVAAVLLEARAARPW